MSARTRPDRDDARVARVPLDRLRAHPQNIRHDLGDLRDLAASIATDGVLVPLMAEKRGDVLQLLHGHRRAAAAELAGERRVPCVIVPAHTDDQAIVLMVAENTSRAGLTRAEKRDAVNTLHDQHKYTFSEIAERLGVAASTVHSWRQLAAEDVAGDDEIELATDDAHAPPGPPGWTTSSSRPRPATTTKSRPPAKPPNVVSRQRLLDVVDRWDGHAPPALLAQLRDLTGARDNGTSLDGRRVTG